MDLVGRSWRLEVGKPGGVARQYLDLRLQFRASFSGQGGQSTCDVVVSNPDPAIVGALHDRSNVWRVLAGYKDGPVEVFQGFQLPYSFQDRRFRDEPEIQFQLTASGRILQAATVDAWLPGVATAAQIVDEIRRTLGVAADVINLGPAPPSFARGYLLQGAPGPALTSICNDCGCTWTITHGRLRIWPRGEPASRTADLWTSATGLLSASLPAQDGSIQASALLRPALRPGDLIRLDDGAVWRGSLVLVDVNHAGDTDGDTWVSEVKGFRYA